MATRVLVGNLVADGIVTMTPAADPLFPETFLSDGPGQLGARFGALDANPEVKIDLGAVEYGDGSGPVATVGDTIAISENDIPVPPDVPTDWSIELGTPASSGTYGHLYISDNTGAGGADHGGNGLSLVLAAVGTSGVLTAKLPLTKRAGTLCRITAWAQKLVSDTGAVAVRLYDRTRGLYLKNDATWTATPTDLLQAGTYDFVTTWFGLSGGYLDFAVATREEAASDTVQLELQLISTVSESTAARFDDLAIFEAVDLMGVFNGHNITANLAPIWESSDDGSSWTNRATFAVARHQFLALLDAPIYARFHRLGMTGTPVAKIWLSDLVLGLTEALQREPQEPIDKEYSEPGQQRLESPAGSRRISNRGPYAPRRYTLRFRFATAAEEASVIGLLVGVIRGGENPVVVIPATDLGPAAAVYGDLQAGVTVTHSMLSSFQPDQESREFYSDATFVVDEGAGFTLE